MFKQPEMQLNIIEVTTHLAENSEAKTSVTVISAISDLVRHLRKSMQSTLDKAEMGDDMAKWNKRFQKSIDECLTQLSKKVSFIIRQFITVLLTKKKNYYCVLFILVHQECFKLVCFPLFCRKYMQ